MHAVNDARRLRPAPSWQSRANGCQDRGQGIERTGQPEIVAGDQNTRGQCRCAVEQKAVIRCFKLIASRAVDGAAGSPEH